jgi:hypothetical protein
MVTYNGVNLFGAAVRIQHLPRPHAQQWNTYFGVSGAQALHGGGRGRVFVISGILLSPTLEGLNAAEGAFHNYADGVARMLVDNRGRSWPNVIFRGEFTPDPRGPQVTPSGWALPYRAIFYGLT